MEDELLDRAVAWRTRDPRSPATGKAVVTIESLPAHVRGSRAPPSRPSTGTTTRGAYERFARWRLEWEARRARLSIIRPRECGWRPRSSSGSRASTIATSCARASRANRTSELRIGYPTRTQAASRRRLLGHGPSRDELLAGGLAGRAPEDRRQRAGDPRPETPQVRRIGLPGRRRVATAADLALFYQALVGGGHGPRFCATRHNRPRLRGAQPRTARPGGRHAINRGLGVVVAGDTHRARAVRHTGSPRHVRPQRRGRPDRLADPEDGPVVRVLQQRLPAMHCAGAPHRGALDARRRCVSD